MEREIITVERIRRLSAVNANIVMSSHANLQCIERIIDSSDILKVLQHGEIIEDYPDDYPFPSCLMLDFIKPDKPMHVCCGVGEGKIYIITAYYPNPKKWESDMKTRKVVTK